MEERENKREETLHEKKVISNLSAKTAYQLRARVGDIVSNEITITKVKTNSFDRPVKDVVIEKIRR